MPGQFHNTCKFYGLGIIINMIDVAKFETNRDLYRTVFQWQCPYGFIALGELGARLLLTGSRS